MRFLTVVLIALVLTTALAADFKLSDDEQAVLDLTNAERKKQNLPALKANEALTRAAREHSANMAKQQKLDHVLDEKGPDARVKAIGYKYSALAENCAMGQKTPAEAITTWIESAPHKANLLNGTYTEIGIGVAADATGQRYWTQVFAKPLGKRIQ